MPWIVFKSKQNCVLELDSLFYHRKESAFYFFWKHIKFDNSIIINIPEASVIFSRDCCDTEEFLGEVKFIGRHKGCLECFNSDDWISKDLRWKKK